MTQEQVKTLLKNIEGMTRDEVVEVFIAAFESGYLSLETLLEWAISWGGKHPHWISVEDELPPRETFFHLNKFKKEDIEKHNFKDMELNNSVSCLVVVRNGLQMFSHYNYEKKAWSVLCGEEVTHWMPLPEPPSGKGGEE